MPLDYGDMAQYKYNRVLIEASRILNPQFPSIILVLDGAQVELLRNVTEYLNRLSTYVDQFYDVGYTVPTQADFDDIQAIVADLEGKLMSDVNIPWSYNRQILQRTYDLNMPGGSSGINMLTVPSGEMWVIEQVCFYTTSITCDYVLVGVQDPDYFIPVHYVQTPSPGQYYPQPLKLICKEGDYVLFWFVGMTAGDDCYCYMLGSSMIVPPVE